MACARSFLQEFQKSFFFRVSDYVSQLLSSRPKDFGKKHLIVATLLIPNLFAPPMVLFIEATLNC